MNAALDEAVALQKRIDALVEQRDGLQPKPVKDEGELKSLQKDFETFSNDLEKLRRQVGKALAEAKQEVYKKREELDKQIHTLIRAQNAVLRQNPSQFVQPGTVSDYV